MGTWVNGKTLYQKTIELNEVLTAGDHIINHNIENIDMIVDYKCMAIQGNNFELLPNAWPVHKGYDSQCIWCSLTKTAVRFYLVCDWSAITKEYVTM